MRHLILMRGAPGSGKSTWIGQQGLDAFVISPDEFRLRIGGVIMNAAGDMTVSHQYEKRVWNEIEKALEFKMSLGQTIVVDATFQQTKDFTMPKKLADRYGYRLLCIDFTKVEKETALKQNLMREPWKQVPERVIHTAYDRFERHQLPKMVTAIDPFENDGQNLLDFLEPETKDLTDKYECIHHIGDLQGCFEPVAEFFKNGFNEDHLYIFIGDLLDRGIQNGEVIRFAVDELINRKNVILIFGNHEYHIQRFAKNLDPVSKEFKFATLPQLLKTGFTTKEANTLLRKMVDVYAYKFHDRQVLVTHAGLSRVPERLAIMSGQQFWKGTGTYDDPVDDTFAKNMDGSNWWQVHGHRNSKKLAVEAAPGSFNLEAEVEFGGHLRIVSFKGENGKVVAHPLEIKNNLFRKEQPTPGPDQINKINVKTGKLSEETAEKLANHKLVKEKRFATYPYLRSINFTREAFFNGKWDQVNTMARGLFVADDQTIVARSYPKFFNLEERAETQMRNLRNNLEFPLRLWVKENGFLGILGWDHYKDDLFFASKSTPEFDFAGWFREIFMDEAGEKGAKRAGEIIAHRNVSLVFEVNDPKRDPHMIAYDKAHVVLLDAIFREEEFGTLPYEELKQLAELIGVKVKQPGPVFQNFKDFAGWNQMVELSERHFKWKDKHIEGFVAEDVAGNMFKIKLDFYSFWKKMRGMRDRIRRAREKGHPLPEAPSDAEAAAFHEWLLTRPDEDLVKDIIQLREAFHGDWVV